MQGDGARTSPDQRQGLKVDTSAHNELRTLIEEMVLEARGQGLFLSYTDHEVIDFWLEHIRDSSVLLEILSTLLPKLFRQSRKRNLSSIKAAVIKKHLELTRLRS